MKRKEERDRLGECEAIGTPQQAKGRGGGGWDRENSEEKGRVQKG